jgi:hypothetical protein
MLGFKTTMRAKNTLEVQALKVRREQTEAVLVSYFCNFAA